MKSISVVAAIIVDGNRILSTQRGYGEFKGGWEFPGGKVRSWETPEKAIAREIKEELAATIEVGPLLHTVHYDYPTFHLDMDCFVCKLAENEFTLLEHQAARWLTAEEIDDVEWLPADLEVVEAIKKAQLI